MLFCFVYNFELGYVRHLETRHAAHCHGACLFPTRRVKNVNNLRLQFFFHKLALYNNTGRHLAEPIPPTAAAARRRCDAFTVSVWFFRFLFIARVAQRVSAAPYDVHPPTLPCRTGTPRALVIIDVSDTRRTAKENNSCFY